MIGFNKVNLFYQFKVCANVDEIFCDVEPYTDCNMPQNDVFYNDTEDSIKTWPIIKCYDEQGFHHQLEGVTTRLIGGHALLFDEKGGYEVWFEL